MHVSSPSILVSSDAVPQGNTGTAHVLDVMKKNAVVRVICGQQKYECFFLIDFAIFSQFLFSGGV